MKLNKLKRNETTIRNQEMEIIEDDCSEIVQPDSAVEGREDNNLMVKASMAAELIDMGLSRDSIERILNLRSDVLNRLL